ncbi:MAG: stage IV sporulation protein A, partial [Clostridia bacterium]
FDLYQDIATRTNGDIYIGVVGPVRTGKSTFISKFMQSLVLPHIDDANRKQRIIDELPQSADGKTIMTTQPKFVPDGGVKVGLGEGLDANIRLIDCVGYPFDGAKGFDEGDKQRLVKTPWSDEELPFLEAAEIGTNKVITDHSTIGVLVTTDGSITDIARDNYVIAEERVVAELQSLDKPFVIVLNTARPLDSDTSRLRSDLQQKYNAPVVTQDVDKMTADDIAQILQTVLMQFPLKMVNIDMPMWLQALPKNSEIIKHIIAKTTSYCAEVSKMQDYKKLDGMFVDDQFITNNSVVKPDFGRGEIAVAIAPKPELFYQVLSEQCGQTIEDDFKLVSYIKELGVAKTQYDKIKTALADANEFGYGVVAPSLEDMSLMPPEIVRKGNKFGVKLHANAASLHIMKVNVETDVNPMIADMQDETVLQGWLDSLGEDGIWQTNMFGKSLDDLAKEGLYGKIAGVPEDTRDKLRRAITRIVNEGKGGVMCILL